MALAHLRRNPLLPHLIHIVTLAICAVLLIYGILTAHLFSMHNFGMGAIVMSAPALIAPLLVPAAYWHQHGNPDKRDAALTLPWLVVLMVLIPFVVVVSVRIGMPLSDQLFMRLDQHLGLNVPTTMTWASRHPLVESVLDRAYTLLFWLLAAAALVPPLMGRRKPAQEFLLANAIVFLLAVPFFTLFPAIGPWVVYHFPPNPAQKLCELSIRSMHQSVRPDAVKAFGVVCFPSFHAVWAVLSAVALRSIKWLCFPAAILAALIVASTLTTGWHYGVDVLGGLVLCALGLGVARLVIRLADRAVSE